MFFITLIGFLLLFGAIAFFIFRNWIREERVTKKVTRYGDTFDEVLHEKSHHSLINLKRKPKLVIILGAVGLFLILADYLFFYSKQGHQYYLVYPSGDWGTHYEPGFKWRGFARIQEWQKEIDIKTVDDDDNTEGIEGVIRDKTTFQSLVDGRVVTTTAPGIHITFIDRVNAAAKVSVRMKMPDDDKNFRYLAESFRTQENLINNTLVPTIREQLSNVGYQFAAQDYISGAATDFRQAIDDQLKNGGYSTKRTEFHDTIYSVITDGGPRSIKEINTRYQIIKNVDKNGNLIRIPHEITKNNVFVTQVIMDAVTPEPAFQQRLEAQRDISAQKRIEMEKIETAKAAQQRIVAEGERDKADERVKQEKEQVKVLIAIETELKKEATNKQLAEIALQTARLDAEKLVVQGRAEAEANRLKVQAGLTPQERAEWEYKTAVGVAEKLSALKLPSVYMTGSQGGKEGILSDLIGAKLAEGMIPTNK